MKYGSRRSRLALAAGLALAVAAVPRPGGAAGDPGGAARARRVSFAPLFDKGTGFKPKHTFKLRFRARDMSSGAPLTADDISFSMHHDNAIVAAPARQLKKGVFEVAFTPAGPGRYDLVVAVRGAPAGSIAPVHLGVVGVADGIIELPPEADAEVARRGKYSGKSAR